MCKGVRLAPPVADAKARDAWLAAGRMAGADACRVACAVPSAAATV